jgi:UDP-N-acetyl-D-mannosaminuronate dehydrogenase
MTQLAEKLADKSALVGIVGLGYVGLPLARVCERLRNPGL